MGAEEPKKKPLDWPEAKPLSELDSTDLAMLRMMKPVITPAPPPKKYVRTDLAEAKYDCDCGICNFCNGGRSVYYEEQVIEGVLSWRGTSDGKWTAFTAQELTKRVMEKEEALQQIRNLACGA